MTTVSRKTSVSLTFGLPVLAVIFSSAGLVAPAAAAQELPLGPGTTRVADSPLAATLSAGSTKVVTGKQVSLTGTSPSVLGLSLPLPVAIEQSVGGGAFTKVADVTPEADGSFSYTAAQQRSSTYRAVPLAPVGEVLTVVLPELVASAPVAVATQGTVSMTAKRTARRTYVVSGRATPATAGQGVKLQVKQGRTYRTIGSTTTRADGGYASRVRLAKGKRTLRVVTVTTADALAASSTRVVRIR
ncbi:hypothetical protein [Nocardioides marmoraquaticus]